MSNEIYGSSAPFHRLENRPFPFLRLPHEQRIEIYILWISDTFDFGPPYYTSSCLHWPFSLSGRPRCRIISRDYGEHGLVWMYINREIYAEFSDLWYSLAHYQFDIGRPVSKDWEEEEDDDDEEEEEEGEEGEEEENEQDEKDVNIRGEDEDDAMIDYNAFNTASAGEFDMNFYYNSDWMIGGGNGDTADISSECLNKIRNCTVECFRLQKAKRSRGMWEKELVVPHLKATFAAQHCRQLDNLNIYFYGYQNCSAKRRRQIWEEELVTLTEIPGLRKLGMYFKIHVWDGYESDGKDPDNWWRRDGKQSWTSPDEGRKGDGGGGHYQIWQRRTM